MKNSVSQEKIHRLIISPKTEEKKIGANLIVSNFISLPDKKKAWNDLLSLIKEDYSVRQIAIKAIGQTFPYIPDKEQAWNDVLRSTDDWRFDFDGYGSEVICQIFSYIPNKEKGWDDLLRKTGRYFQRSGVVKTLGLVFIHVPDKEKAWKDIIGLDFTWSFHGYEIEQDATGVLTNAFPHVPNKGKAWNDLLRLAECSNFTTQVETALAIKKGYHYVPDKEKAWNDLLRLTKTNPNFFVRRKTAEALGQALLQIPDRQKTWDLLVGLARDENPYMRRGAAEALGQAFPFVPNKEKAWNDLVILSSNKVKDYSVRQKAIQALGKAYASVADRKSAWKVILQLVTHGDARIRIYAKHSAGKALVYEASLCNGDAFQQKLSNAIQFFENSYKESVNIGGLKPAGFCLLMYRAFYAVTFNSGYGAKEYVSDAKFAVSGSDTKEQLLMIIVNLESALNEVRDYSTTNSSLIKGKLLECSRYCDQAEIMLETVEDKVPAAARIMRKGAQIVKRDIDEIKSQIYCQAKEICLLVRDKGFPYGEFGSEIYQFGKHLKDEDNVQSVISGRYPGLAKRTSDFPRQIGYPLKTSIFAISQSTIKEEQLFSIKKSLKEIQQILEIGLPAIDRRNDIIFSKVCDIDIHLDQIKESILSQLDKSERNIITVFLSHLNESDIRITNELVGAIKNQKLDQEDLKIVETIVGETCKIVAEKQEEIVRQQTELANTIVNFIELQKTPDYNVRHRIVVTIPLIPVLMNYTVIHEVQSGKKIKALWTKVKQIWKRNSGN